MRKPVTGIYLQLVDQIHARIRRLGLPMWRCDDLSGLQDGYTAKLLHPDTPSGRQARWETLQLLIDAVFPEGYVVTIRPRGKGTPKRCQRTPNAQVDQRIRSVMMTMGRQGGLKTAERRALMAAADKARMTEEARAKRWAHKRPIYRDKGEERERRPAPRVPRLRREEE